MITHLAVVPTTPLLLPGLPGTPHPDMARLAATARRVTAGMGGADVVIAVAGGTAMQVVDAPDADLIGYGVAGLPAHRLAPAPDQVIARLREVLAPAAPSGAIGALGAHGGGAARPRTGSGADHDIVGPDLAVLVRHVPAGIPCVGVVVPAMADAITATALAQAIVDVALDRRVAVVAAGDLSAGHGPKPPRPMAAGASTIVDDQVIAALDNGRPMDLVRLDPALAEESAARAIGALRVIGALADAAKTATVVRATGAPLGVGYVIAQGAEP